MSDACPSAAEVERALADFRDPETGRSVIEMQQVDKIHCAGGKLALRLALTTHSAPLWRETQADCVERLRGAFPGLAEIAVELAVHPRGANRLGEIGLAVKSVIAVGSGKGGVGKSTVAALLAYGLRRAGARAGLMDADVYGPSIPHLVGASGRPQVIDKKIEPIEAGGLKVMSMGFLVPPGEAVVWRGPMLHGAITQFLRDTNWGELDYLVIDLPPGTGDIALSLSQLLPLSGAVVVCTPQDVALLDAEKAIAMFEKVKIPVLGMVENMSYFVAPETGARYEIFGRGGARRRAEERGLPFLGEIPIQLPIRELGDAGRIAAVYDDPQAAPFFEAIVKRLVKGLADANRANPPLPSLSVL